MGVARGVVTGVTLSYVISLELNVCLKYTVQLGASAANPHHDMHTHT
jgi:hypothetical protein